MPTSHALDLLTSLNAQTTFTMHVVALLLLITAAAAAVVWPASAANWPHTATSSAQVQRFLTFDSKVSAADIATSAAQYDYVWGAESSHVPLYRASNNPTIVLSKCVHAFTIPLRVICASKLTTCAPIVRYMPFSRDPGPANLTWWQQHHPSWVLYRYGCHDAFVMRYTRSTYTLCVRNLLRGFQV